MTPYLNLGTIFSINKGKAIRGHPVKAKGGKATMWNEPTKERLDEIPRLYETENIPLEDKEIYLHFFIGGSDWYIAEYDGEDLFFGFTILNGDLQYAEWGYISFNDLKKLKIGKWLEVDCEKSRFWKVRPFKEIGIS